jgi:hypothetical protein
MKEKGACWHPSLIRLGFLLGQYKLSFVITTVWCYTVW